MSLGFFNSLIVSTKKPCGERGITQLQNFTATDKEAKAHVQLQNPELGEAAVMTPKELKAFFMKVPYEIENVPTNDDIDAIKTGVRKRLGTTPRSPIDLDDTQEIPSPKSKASKKKKPPEDDGDDDFFIEID